MKIGVIDYGMGNLRSVLTGFKRVGVTGVIVRNPEELKSVDKIVLPGVGAFGDAVRNLEGKNFYQAIREEVKRGKPLLGICLGFQLLFEGSEESPGYTGLGFFKGLVRRFPESGGIKIPHIGWNSIRIMRSSKLYEGIQDGTYFYFVHSYYAERCDFTLTETDYHIIFTSSIENENIAGTQFHPEKSQKDGLRLLENYAFRFGE